MYVHFEIMLCIVSGSCTSNMCGKNLKFYFYAMQNLNKISVCSLLIPLICNMHIPFLLSYKTLLNNELHLFIQLTNTELLF